MDVDVPRLMVLRAVRDAGGVLAAADELRVSSSAVSQQLSKLERETGLALVARGSNAPLRLTPAGQRLAERADAIAAELRSTRHDIVQLADERQRTVRVGAFPSALQALVIPAAAALRSSLLAIDVQAVETREESAALDSRVRSGDLDLAVAKQEGRHVPGNGLTEVVVRDDAYRIIVPAGWSAPASLVDVLDRPWTGHPQGSPGRAALDRLEQQEGVTLRVDHECTEYPVAIAIAAAGLAASIVPQLALAANHHHGIRVLDLADVGSRRIVARYRTEPELPIAIAAVLDRIRNPVPL